MSAFRRLTSSLRSERRCEQACPYSRPQPSPPKPKPTRRPRYWDFFNFFSFAAPYTDEEEEEAKKEAEAKAKASQQAEVIVAPEQDSEMSDASISASSTEDSTTTTSDTSAETVERVEHVEASKDTDFAQSTTRTAEPVEPAESMRGVESAIPVEQMSSTQSTKTMNVVPSQPLLPPSKKSAMPISSSFPPPPPTATSEDEIMEWAQRKFESQTPFNNDDYLGLKAFLERRSRERPFSPIKLKYPRFTTPSRVSPPGDSISNAQVSQESTIPDATTVPISVDSHNSSPEEPSYHSAFHSSTGLPTFKNNIRIRPKKMLGKAPIKSVSTRISEESRKRPVPLVTLRFDPYKRRRLFGEANGPLATPEVGTSQNILGNVTGSGPSVSTRSPRTGVSRQHAAPHAPSPLRNVINGSPSVSPPRQARTIPTNLSATSSKSVPANQTASAAYLQEAVEKVMPRRPRYSDVINPYQTTALVKPVIKPMERKRMAERRARSKEVEKQKEMTKMKEAEKRELSVKDIIEATVPKGAKRSRPPPGLGKGKARNSVVPGRGSKRVLEGSEEELTPTKKRRTVTVEEVFEDDDVRTRPFPARSNVIIESRSPSPELTPAPSRPPAETSCIKEPSTKVSSPKMSAQVSPVVQPSVKETPVKASPIKEPPVRAKEQTAKSLQTQKPPSPRESTARASTKGSSGKGPSNHFSPLLNSKVTGKSSVPREPSKLRTSFLPDECENEEPKMASPTPSAIVTMTTPGTPLADIQEKKDPKEVALTLPLNDLPSFIFKTPPALTAGDHTDARVAAKEIPIASLPRFDFSKARATMNGLLFPAVPIPTIKPFDFEVASVKPSLSSDCNQWQCPTCMLQNSKSVVEKCLVCEAPRPDAEKPKKLAVNGINGVKNLNGKASSKSKSTSSVLPDVKTFDFAAAGLTSKTPVADAQWTCSTCMLQNPATAVEKCIVCDSPRVGTEKSEKLEKPKKSYMNGVAHSSKTPTNGVMSPAAKSVDSTAAGLAPKEPAVNGKWHCPTCMLQNPMSALEKCKVCDSPRPGTEKKAVQLPIVPVKSIPQLLPKSFDWTRAGLVPKVSGNSWTCGTCMLSNPPTETEKCKVCDASRS